ncbi:Pescadillo like, partial [Actinidia chinensis var. chinensis]
MSSPVPAKSQPLHNFSLPLLKWTKSQTNHHHRGRRLSGSSPPPPDSVAGRRQSPLLDLAWRQSPMRDSASESESGYASENRRNSTPEDVKNGVIEKSEKKSADVDGDGGKDGRSKIYIRLRKNKSDDVQNEGKTGTEGGEVDELVGKSWNLRPRKPIRKLSNANGGVSLQENKASQQITPNRPDLIRMQTGPEAEIAEKKEKKQKFSVSLSRLEIEEDVFALTGSKPARRPKKRAKIVQKQLDNLFPGLWLAAITPDSYKVSDAPLK